MTLGDPGLVRLRREDATHVTALRNQFDALFGIVAAPSGKHEQVSNAHVTRNGWFLSIEDVGGHLNYANTLADEADRSSMTALALCRGPGDAIGVEDKQG